MVDILLLKQRILRQLTNKALYYPSSNNEILSYFMKRKDFVCGIYYHNKIVGFSTVSHYRNKKYVIEDTVVLEQYRGNGYQRKMWRFIINSLPKNATIYCTIHPNNCYSLKNALSLGFKIKKAVKIYNNSPRYILQYR